MVGSPVFLTWWVKFLRVLGKVDYRYILPELYGQEVVNVGVPAPIFKYYLNRRGSNGKGVLPIIRIASKSW